MNTNAIYMIGNGHVAAAFAGGNMMQCFGPPYSSASVLEADFIQPEQWVGTSVRHLPKSGIWQIDLTADENIFATVTDFAMSEEKCIVRHIESSKPVCMRIRPCGGNKNFFQYEEVSNSEKQTKILLKARSGNYVLFDKYYPLSHPQFFYVIVRGAAKTQHTSDFTYDITVDGIADILIIGGPSYPESDTTAERVADLPYEHMLNSTRAWWEKLMDSIEVINQIPANMPRRDELVAAIEDTVINLTVQQGAEGGVIAGHLYHLGYVRDQYGVCMAMLRMGMYEQARRMLDFYREVFKYSGVIYNAQGIGVKGLFHFAENDKSEITGYLLLQFFRYADITGDTQILLDSIDFLTWLYEQQVSQLADGMMPFNGDETYIAGHLMPRDVINEGSAEATMLFIISGKRLLDFLKEKNLTSSEKLFEMEQILTLTEDKYTENFIQDGKYTLNNPARLEKTEQPVYRYGVCACIGSEGCEDIGWTKLCEGDVYVCAHCLNIGRVPKKKSGMYYLPSALLMPAYLEANLLDKKLITDYLEELVIRLRKDGYVYSDEKAKKNVGYDYGLLLCNLVRYGMDGAELAYNKLLDIIDEVGAWSEYYIEDKPVGTRYRPWESGINIDALIEYALSLREK